MEIVTEWLAYADPQKAEPSLLQMLGIWVNAAQPENIGKEKNKMSYQLNCAIGEIDLIEEELIKLLYTPYGFSDIVESLKAIQSASKAAKERINNEIQNNLTKIK